MRISAAGLIVVTSVSLANATYVIKLKNGNEYVTNRYWQEESQVMFDAEGGIFGIEKAFVESIDKTDKVIKIASVAKQDPSAVSQPRADQGEKEPPKPSPQIKAQPSPEKDENDLIVSDVAKLQQRAENLRAMFPEDIRALLKDISDYRTKIVKNSKLFIEYGREFNELQKMAAAADEALRK